MIAKSADGKIRVLSLSYGKDSMACLGALEMLGWPLDRIVTVDMMATSTISADWPCMEKFKSTADSIILNRYGILVEHYKPNKTFEEWFYQVRTERAKKCPGIIYGWPIVRGPWCNSNLKMEAIRKARNSLKDAIEYIGIAADETVRIMRHINKPRVELPLVTVGWSESDCMAWCDSHGLLSPIYKDNTRGGCWFCYNQGIEQLRKLRREYPDLWGYMLKWDIDSPVSFRPDGHTVHDFDKRFAMEDRDLVPKDRRFRWSMI